MYKFKYRFVYRDAMNLGKQLKFLQQQEESICH